MDANAVNESIRIVKAGMQHLEKRYEECRTGAEPAPADFQPFYDACSEDVVFHIPMTTEPVDGEYTKPPWNVLGKPREGKAALIETFVADQSNLNGWEIGAPLEYLASADGSRVVVLLKERYGVGGSEQVPWSEAAMLFDVKDGKITYYKHLADMSGYLVATNYFALVGPSS